VSSGANFDVQDFPDPPHGTRDNDIIYLNNGDDLFVDTYVGLFLDPSPTNPFRYETYNWDGGKDWIYGGLGADNIYAGAGKDYVYGGPNKDFIQGGDDNDYLYGNDAEDIIGGNQGDDFLDGGAGDDILGVQWFGDPAFPNTTQLLHPTWNFGEPGDDRIVGGPGEDTINAGTGADNIWGGTEGDTFRFNLGADGILNGQVDTIHDLEPQHWLAPPPGGDPVVVKYDTIVIDYSALPGGVGSEFSSQFLNSIDYQLEAGVNANFQYSDSYAGFVFDHRTHDFVYDVGQDTVIPLLHLNNEIDRLYVIEMTNTTITLGGLLLGEP
jgi:hypothetical protein